MPVTPTYPGLYIEEILSNSHTITADPSAPNDLADVTITYAGRAETFRRVSLHPAPPAQDQHNTLERRIGTAPHRYPPW
jgi:hypothetical protein